MAKIVYTLHSHVASLGGYMKPAITVFFNERSAIEYARRNWTIACFETDFSRSFFCRVSTGVISVESCGFDKQNGVENFKAIEGGAK